MPPRPPARSPFRPRWTPRAVWRAVRRALPRLLPAAGLAVLALLGACAPDTVTAPRAAAGGGPRAYLATTPGTYTQVSTSFWHSCGVSAGGAVACWGSNSDGERDVPAGLRGVTQVSAGRLHSCAVTAAGAVACWGYNAFGAAQPPADLSGVTQVSAGGLHSCALAAGSAIACWGDNGRGQAAPPTGTGYTQVNAGGLHSCALAADGAIVCWGDRTYDRTTPPAGAGYTQVSGGGGHTCAVAADGTVACWGQNTEHQTDVPADLRGVTQVSAGWLTTCAVAAGGVVSCWGNNTYGQRDVPDGLRGITQVSAGLGQTCAVDAHGAVTCWGSVTGAFIAPVPPATTARVFPTATFTAPASATVGQPFTLALTGAQVPGHPEAARFTYAFDCGDGAGYAAPSSTASASCPTTSAGSRTVRGKVVDQDGDTASYRATVEVTRAAQAITVAAGLPASALVTSTFTLAAAGGASGAPVVFATQTPATCTTAGANGTTLTLVAAGACRVQATQAGTATYAPAASVTLAVTVLSPAQGTSQLRSAVAAAGLKADVRRGLTDKLDAAAAALTAGQTGAACNQLAAFQNQVQAQRGAAIPAGTADAWLAQAAQLRRAAGC